MKVGHFYRSNFGAPYIIDHNGIEIPDKHAEGLLMHYPKLLEKAPKPEEGGMKYKQRMVALNKMKRPELMKRAAEAGVPGNEIGSMKNAELKSVIAIKIKEDIKNGV